MRKKEKKKMKKVIVLEIAIVTLLLLSGTAKAATVDPITQHTSLVSIPGYADPGDTFWINHTFTSTKEIDITLYHNITPSADGGGWNTTALLNDDEIHSGAGNFTNHSLVAKEGLNELAFQHTSEPWISANMTYRFDASLSYEPIVVPTPTPTPRFRGGGGGGGRAVTTPTPTPTATATPAVTPSPTPTPAVTPKPTATPEYLPTPTPEPIPRIAMKKIRMISILAVIAAIALISAIYLMWRMKKM